MANNYEISPNLIEQVQILLKKEAGAESLNSCDHSLVDDSSQSSFLNEAILGSKSSHNDISRCKNCEGELLRGSESIICVYCGNAQLHDDVVRQPISFKSTFAFQWFLQSLKLDGSVSSFLIYAQFVMFVQFFLAVCLFLYEVICNSIVRRTII